MLTIAVLAGPWPRVGVVAAALFAASAMLARTDERRAWSMLGALVLAPALLLYDVWHSPQLSTVTATRSWLSSVPPSRWQCSRRLPTACTGSPGWWAR